MKMPDASAISGQLHTKRSRNRPSYHIRLTDDIRMFIPVRNHLYARRCEKHFLRDSRPGAAMATNFVQSLNFGLGNLGASSNCAAKNKGATPLGGYGVCGTVSSMLSGLETRSLGLNTLGTTKYPASSQSVQISRSSTASWV